MCPCSIETTGILFRSKLSPETPKRATASLVNHLQVLPTPQKHANCNFMKGILLGSAPPNDPVWKAWCLNIERNHVKPDFENCFLEKRAVVSALLTAHFNDDSVTGSTRAPNDEGSRHRNQSCRLFWGDESVLRHALQLRWRQINSYSGIVVNP